MWNSFPSSMVSSKTTEEYKALIWISVSEVCVASAQLLENSFDGPSRMFFPVAIFKM